MKQSLIKRILLELGQQVQNLLLNIWDVEHLLEGAQSGMNSKGLEYALSVEDPLHFAD